MAKKKDISIYLSYILRHKPDDIDLAMDKHGWVDVAQLIDKINSNSSYSITLSQLKDIVASDNKGRYRFNTDGSRIKACQGHSIPWVEPELDYRTPPDFLYHGTTLEAYRKIQKSGHISKMSRHAVHLTADESMAWKSAKRWNKTPIVLKISAHDMCETGYVFGCSDNDVWCIEEVPMCYVVEEIYDEDHDKPHLDFLQRLRNAAEKGKRWCYDCENCTEDHFCGYVSHSCMIHGSLDCDQKERHPDTTADTCKDYKFNGKHWFEK